MAAATSPPY